MEENLRKSLDKCKEMLAENKKSDNLEQVKYDYKMLLNKNEKYFANSFFIK